MKENFEKSADFVLKQEVRPGHENDGDLHTDPGDPGGTTRFGISQRAYPHIDMEKLDKAGAMQIYKQIWEDAGCDMYQWPMDLIVFDTAFNMGKKAALLILAKYDGNAANYLFGRLAVYWAIWKKRRTSAFPDWVKRTITLYFTAMGG